MTRKTDSTDSEGNVLLRLLPTEDLSIHGIAVRPRWPYTEVLITEDTLTALRKGCAAITKQAPGIKLAVIRGYETPEQTGRRNLLRLLGTTVFLVLYPWRYAEIRSIFSPNGHDRSGQHIDVNFSLNGVNVILLKYGPLTSLTAIRRTVAQLGRELNLIWGTLEACGFRIHPNISEALQIHCDLIQLVT